MRVTEYTAALEWALQQIHLANSPRNPHREAQLRAAIHYGLTVIVCGQNREKLPARPDMGRCV